MDKLIKKIEFTDKLYTILIDYGQDERTKNDLSNLLENAEFFAAVSDPSFFRTLGIIEDGEALAWPGGKLAMDADKLYRQGELMLTDGQWERCEGAWWNKGWDARNKHGDRTREILDKAYRGFVVEFVGQTNNKMERRKIQHSGEFELFTEELAAINRYSDGSDRALTFHMVAVLNQLTKQPTPGLDDDTAYVLLKETVRLAVENFEAVTNDADTRERPHVPRTRVGTTEENDVANKALLFDLLRNPKSLLNELRETHDVIDVRPVRE